MARKHGVPAACHILRWAFLLASWSPVAWTQCTAPGCWPGKFYQFHVIGQAGQVTAAGAFTGFGDQPSLNDNGLVAFVGQIGSGNFEGVFTGNGSATPAWITTGFSSSGRTFGRAVQINNSSQIAARDSIPGSPPPSLVRIWNAASPGSWTLIAQGGSTGPFASIFAQPSTNTSAQVVFSALDQNGNTLLATPKGSGNPPFNEVRLSTPLRPMIDDNGNVVVRAGSTTTSPILLYPNNLGASLTIASTAEFDFIGQSPGISRDGKVVAFAGSLNPTGATH